MRDAWRRVAGWLRFLRLDTFGKRLFLLLWVTLVVSHLLGFALIRPGLGRDPGWHPIDPRAPMPGPWQAGSPGDRPDSPDEALQDRPQDGPRPLPHPQPSDSLRHLVLPPFLPPHAMPSASEGPGDWRGGPSWRPDAPHGLAPDGRVEQGGQGWPGGPPGQPWVEMLARVLVLGVGAWLGARWLTAPMRRLTSTAQALSRAITRRGTALPLMDERTGPAEVRQAAEVFNNMARHLHEQFEQRSLMMAAVSHDLRTPLTRLRMRLERLQPDPEVARCVADVQDINAMIDAVLDAMNEERRQEAPELVDVLALVQAMVDDLQEAGQPATAVGEPASVRVPPIGLRRVLDNLIGNALRHGHRADVVVQVVQGLHTGRTPRDRRVVITIDDAGPGIPPDQLEAVFKPFYKVDAARARASGDRGGSGLGLYIARELVERGGGELQLSNRPEGGLRATLSYPAA